MNDPLLKTIAKNKNVIPYREYLRQICGSITATILLQQIVYWWHIQNCEAFYKYKAPPKQQDRESDKEFKKRIPTYKKGDSWTEELGFSKSEFNCALKQIAHKRGTIISEEDDSTYPVKRCIQYWTTIDRLTHYDIIDPEYLDNLITYLNSIKSKSSKRPKIINGYIYFIKFGKYTKIGKAINISNRLEQISPALPEKCTILHTIKTNNYTKCEKFFHSKFKDKRANGEWFSLTKQNIDEIKKINNKDF